MIRSGHFSDTRQGALHRSAIRIGPEPQRRHVQVVGVVQNARLFDLSQPEPLIVFVSWLQEPEYSDRADVGMIVARVCAKKTA
jgi:hypothetical protein